MSIAKSLVAPCWISADHAVPTLDLGAFAERILLFDRYVLESARLLEIPAIVAACGYQGTSDLIESGALKILSDACSVGEAATTGSDLPPEAFRLVAFRARDLKAHRSDWLQQIMGIPGLSHKEATRLKSLIGTRLLSAPDGAGVPALRATRVDLLGGGDVFPASVVMAARQWAGWEVPADDLQLEIEVVGDDAYVIKSNLADLPGVPADGGRAVIQRGLLGVLGLNHRLEWMQAFAAQPGLRDDDAGLFQTKYGAVASAVAGLNPGRPFGRVLSAAGLPDFASAAREERINFQALLEARKSDEAKAFRDWLPRADEMSEAELAKLIGGLGQRLRRAVNSTSGRVLRVLVGTAAAAPFDPALGAVVGASVSLIDAFLWDKVLPKPGPWGFVDDRLRSVFEGEG